MGKDGKVKISKKNEHRYIMSAVLRGGGYSMKDLVNKDKAELYKLRRAALTRQLSQFDEIRAGNGGTLPEQEQGYEAFYKDEVSFIDAEEATTWLTSCMGIMVPADDIQMYHRMDPKQRRRCRKDAIKNQLMEESKGTAKWEAKRSAIVTMQEAEAAAAKKSKVEGA